MPFVNESSERELNANASRHEPVESSSFGEVFGASVGQVFDEELSVSSLLNREGFSQRERAVKESADAGDINLNDYSKRGIIDYNRIASDHADLNIKTNEQLHQERNDLLAQRRNYAEDVIERGSGTAQFLGAATGYMLDPVNVLTMGIAAPYTASKAVSAIGRAALAGKNAAIITGATELGIQALVFQHKQNIDSPYGAGDALANIAMAATGAAALGATAGGLSAWIESVLKVADDLPQTKDVTASKQYLARFKENLKDAPKADTPEAQIPSDVDYLAEMNNRAEQYSAPSKTPDQYEPPPLAASAESPKIAVQKKLPETFNDGFRTVNPKPIGGSLFREMGPEGFDDLIKNVHANNPDGGFGDELFFADVEDLALGQGANKGFVVKMDGELVSGKKNTSKPGAQIAKGDEFVSDFIATDSIVEIKIPAGAKLRPLTKSLIKSSFDEVSRNSEQITFKKKSGATQPDNADTVAAKEPLRNESAGPDTQQGPKTSPRELDIVQRQGLAQAYENDLKAFNTIENPTAFVDGEAVDAKALIKQFDDELDGIESVLRCAYG
jgi:hypothetical protein